MIDAGQVISSESVSTTDASGDELEATVREQARLVYKIAYSVLRNHHDAEDVAQETFLRFLRHRKRWAEIRDRRAWLAPVAWRVALDRKRMPVEVTLEGAAEVVSKLRAAGAPVDEIAASRQMMSLLERLVNSLPRDLREALILSATEELTSAEISQVLGIPEGSVRTRLLRARGCRNIGCYRFDAALRPHSSSTTHTQRLAAPVGHNAACAADGFWAANVVEPSQACTWAPQGCDAPLTSGAISHSLATHGAGKALVGVPRQCNQARFS